MRANTRKIFFSAALIMIATVISLHLFPCHAKQIIDRNDSQPCLVSLPYSNEDQEEIAVAVYSYEKQNLPSKLIPGGMAFGVRIYTKGVIIVGLSDLTTASGARKCPAKDSGLRVGDTIIEINGVSVNSVKEITEQIEQCNGIALQLGIIRGTSTLQIELLPVRSASDNIYRAGFWLRDSTSGIGTVTYIDPESGMFGGLGHGITDSQSRALLPFESGTVMNVAISGAVKGKAGTPGELKGSFRASRIGTLLANTHAGVFGVLAVIPQECTEAYEVADLDEVQIGEATIRCTVDDGGIREYSIRIDRIHKEDGEWKNFEIVVTDPELISKTGGIVQGMSGSPIIQNGKLIGAVTHVLVGDPTKGYGIYIGNMLRNNT